MSNEMRKENFKWGWSNKSAIYIALGTKGIPIYQYESTDPFLNTFENSKYISFRLTIIKSLLKLKKGMINPKLSTSSFAMYHILFGHSRNNEYFLTIVH